MGNSNSVKFGSINESGKSTRPGYYIKNEKTVIYNGNDINLNEFEFGSFKKLKYGYATTNKYVYYEGKIIPDADSKSFKVLNRKHIMNPTNFVLGCDKYGTYKFGIYSKNKI